MWFTYLSTSHATFIKAAVLYVGSVWHRGGNQIPTFETDSRVGEGVWRCVGRVAKAERLALDAILGDAASAQLWPIAFSERDPSSKVTPLGSKKLHVFAPSPSPNRDPGRRGFTGAARSPSPLRRTQEGAARSPSATLTGVDRAGSKVHGRVQADRTGS